ncbi:MAG: magnesium/cobalt efflux protein [Sphingomonadales bacterium 35-56-22]|jgi:CBS domain containing-hemolysin-like protein|uniref:hemolysin family protein n=1 Tax=Sphingorhabdus sp. TaxID=1902408 RepID=UPI000BC44E39|nr:hemolysin family protein [Sphingorhabdus sp.]OYY16540.1 MAG: magnesium/cobalt efflux protein [Sphingomonadales bacterium 35-56-22]OYY98306.1 MAG: magnesium/cobalt efflux protein [Sphingomonadales bacterium 28-56-43]OYZ60778.1 MAG: magnesium/cobalt efflux protein [Sphingomonadales bacterium 24-56-14]OZA83672.1 MAG: magnesium/cobalt efflux protein [Sphingomonadales bacterium 39-57-19]HQS11966.1 hemolysin family protein [Sphingorhabdus sp.]
MPEGDSFSGSRTATDDDNDGRIWQRLKTMFFGRDHEPTLREQLEEAIAEHEEDSDDADQSDNGGDLTAVERTMLRNLLHFSEHRVDDVMVPRSDIVAIEESAGFADCIAAFAEHGHSRLPVYRDTLDSIIGMIHIKDVFAVLASGEQPPESLEAFIRQPRFVPQNMSVLALLDEMRRTRTHLAIVLDEYSGTEGLVTIEDLVEEIVGEIEDEHDEEPEAMFTQLSPVMWEADARAELDDLAEAIDRKLSEVEEDVDTLGGLAFVIAGQVPDVGQMLTHEASGWKLEILEADEKRVTRIRLFAPSPDTDETDE